jgi:hypothetical protein
MDFPIVLELVVPPSRKAMGGQDFGELSRAAVLVLESRRWCVFDFVDWCSNEALEGPSS